MSTPDAAANRPRPGSDATPEPLTLWLAQAQAGDAAASDRVFRRLYPELRRIARSRLRGHQAPTLLDTEALVHESYLRFVSAGGVALDSRKHFYAYVARAMRHIVIDFARRAGAERRGGDATQVTFDTGLIEQLAAPLPVTALDEALQALEALDAPLAQVVELRFYGGYTDAEIGQALGLGERSVRRLWEKARAFLLLQLGQG